MNTCHAGVKEDARDGVDTRKKDLTSASGVKQPGLGAPAVKQGDMYLYWDNTTNRWMVKVPEWMRDDECENYVEKAYNNMDIISNWLNKLSKSKINKDVNDESCWYRVKGCLGGDNCPHLGCDYGNMDCPGGALCHHDDDGGYCDIYEKYYNEDDEQCPCCGHSIVGADYGCYPYCSYKCSKDDD